MVHSYTSYIDTLQATLVYSTQYDLDRDWQMTPRHLPYSIFWYVVNGKMIFTVDGNMYAAGQGDIVHLPLSSTVSCKTDQCPLSYITVRFDAKIALFPERIWSDVLAFPILYPYDHPQLADYFFQIRQLSKQSITGKHLLLQGTFQLLLGNMLNRLYEHKANEPLPQSKIDARVQTVLNYIHGHPDRLADLSHLYNMVRLSPSHLRAIFRQHTGHSMIGYIHKVKVDLAKQRLLDTDEQVSEIAWKLGFEDANYFSRLFKKLTGDAPNAFRHKNQLL